MSEIDELPETLDELLEEIVPNIEEFTLDMVAAMAQAMNDFMKTISQIANDPDWIMLCLIARIYDDTPLLPAGD